LGQRSVSTTSPNWRVRNFAALLLISKKHFWPRWLMTVPYHRNNKFAYSPVDFLSQFVWMSSSRPPKTSNMPWPMPGCRSSEPQPSHLSQWVDARSSSQPVFSIPRVHPRAWLHPLPQTLRCHC
jgi:hypothetical protein